MKALGEKLIDVHSQHQNLLLNHEDFQLSVIDILANDEEQLTAYKALYQDYKRTSRELAQLIEQAEKSRQDEDYISFQVNQLEEANLQSGEQEELEQEAETLSHAEDIKASLYKVDQLMASDDTTLLSVTKDCMQVLQGISRVFAPAQEWIDRLESCYIELKDLANDVSSAGEDVEYNPTRLEFVNDRLNLIYTLQQKHHVSSVDELIAIAKGLRT
jgi:DNA repair protein RecN (Recombination protein N)